MRTDKQRLTSWDYELARTAARFGNPVVILEMLGKLIPKILLETDQAGGGVRAARKHAISRLLAIAYLRATFGERVDAIQPELQVLNDEALQEVITLQNNLLKLENCDCES